MINTETIQYPYRGYQFGFQSDGLAFIWQVPSSPQRRSRSDFSGGMMIHLVKLAHHSLLKFLPSSSPPVQQG